MDLELVSTLTKHDWMALKAAALRVEAYESPPFTATPFQYREEGELSEAQEEVLVRLYLKGGFTREGCYEYPQSRRTPEILLEEGYIHRESRVERQRGEEYTSLSHAGEAYLKERRVLDYDVVNLRTAQREGVLWLYSKAMPLDPETWDRDPRPQPFKNGKDALRAAQALVDSGASGFTLSGRSVRREVPLFIWERAQGLGFPNEGIMDRSLVLYWQSYFPGQ